MNDHKNSNLTKEKQDETENARDGKESWGQPPIEGRTRQHADEEAGGVQDHREHAACPSDVRMGNFAHENWTWNQITSTCMTRH